MSRRSPASGGWPWIFDAFTELPCVEVRRMFGCVAFYREGRILAVMTGEGDEPWNGLCACVERESHEAAKRALPAVRNHPVLGKWLYVSGDDPAFERTAEAVIGMAAARDPLLGVIPKPRKRKNNGPAARGENQKIR